MAQIIEAIYTKGVLRPKTPLDLKESQQVRLTIE
jgi:predicted DNA-binding antitoxin AbrB/MazE fold protein